MYLAIKIKEADDIIKRKQINISRKLIIVFLESLIW